MSTRGHKFVYRQDLSDFYCEDCGALLDSVSSSGACARQTDPMIPVVRPMCRLCDRELVPELDAYYGRDPYGQGLCTQCRRERDIE